MNGIVNNPSKTIVLPNVTIKDAVTIVNRMVNNISYKAISVDNSMASVNIWGCTYHSKIKGLIDTMLTATFSFVEVQNGLQLTIECGKCIGAISDQWELQDCNLFIKEAMLIAVNPNINNSQTNNTSSQTGNSSIQTGNSSSIKTGVSVAIAIVALIFFILI